MIVIIVVIIINKTMHAENTIVIINMNINMNIDMNVIASFTNIAFMDLHWMPSELLFSLGR